MKPHPIRLGRSLSLEDVKIHRHPNCSYESKCCGKAALKYWKGFSCLSCSFFKKYKREKLNE